MVFSYHWSLNVISVPVTLDPHPHIIQHLSLYLAKQYMLVKKQVLSPLGFAAIDCPALNWVLNGSSPLYQLWFSKFVSGQSATRCMMAFGVNGSIDSGCLCSGHNVLSCPEPSMQCLFLNQVLLLEHWMLSTDTLPDISYCISQSLCMAQPSFLCFSSNSPGHPVPGSHWMV